MKMYIKQVQIGGRGGINVLVFRMIVGGIISNMNCNRNNRNICNYGRKFILFVCIFLYNRFMYRIIVCVGSCLLNGDGEYRDERERQGREGKGREEGVYLLGYFQYNLKQLECYGMGCFIFRVCVCNEYEYDGDCDCCGGWYC